MVDFTIFRVPCKNHYVLIYSYLKVYRKKADLSQSDLAFMTGVSQNTISSYENGTYCPSLAHAFLLCKALHVELFDLFHIFDSDEIVG